MVLCFQHFVAGPGIDRSPEWANATRLFTTNNEVNEHNTRKLYHLQSQVVKINAVNAPKKAREAKSDIAEGLENYIMLARGARVMLRRNLWTEAGLVNGIQGTVVDIIYKEGDMAPVLPRAVLIEFDSDKDGYKGPTISYAGRRVVPITPMTATLDLLHYIVCWPAFATNLIRLILSKSFQK